jgi:hypothetical protein
VHVIFDCGKADPKFDRDLLVRQALLDQGGNLAFTPGETCLNWSGLELVSERCHSIEKQGCDPWRTAQFATYGQVDGSSEFLDLAVAPNEASKTGFGASENALLARIDAKADNSDRWGHTPNLARKRQPFGKRRIQQDSIGRQDRYLGYRLCPAYLSCDLYSAVLGQSRGKSFAVQEYVTDNE